MLVVGYCFTEPIQKGVCWWLKKKVNFQHWLAIGRAFGHKNSAPITPSDNYIFSLHFSSLHASPVCEGHGGMVLKRM